ncbi:MAG: PD-(D/E)XK nuclease-like domain-containing protein [Oscillospiraceae bacterium]
MSELNNNNYFSPENQLKYMGSSQYKAFSRCEAGAMAELRGEYSRPKSTALLVGSYVDAHFEGTLDLFKAQNPELFKRDGGLKSEYIQAEQIISRLEDDELYMLLMSGKKQVIKTGVIAGVPFKIKIDSLLDVEDVQRIIERFPETAPVFGMGDGAIVDQKIMKDLADVWSDEEYRKLPFVEAWGYDIQGAIYQAVEGNMLPFILAVGTKEKEATDIAALYIDDRDLAAKLSEIESNIPRYQAVKKGIITPIRCEKCDYCKASRKLSGILNYKAVL